DQADRGKGGEPAAPGDVGDPAGGREPGERDHQHGRAGGVDRVRQGGRDSPEHAGTGAPGNRAGARGGRRAVRDSRGTKAVGEPGAAEISTAVAMVKAGEHSTPGRMIR